MKCPCKYCVEKRKLGCHGVCTEYREWKAEEEAKRQKKAADLASRGCRSTAYVKLIDRLKRRQ